MSKINVDLSQQAKEDFESSKCRCNPKWRGNANLMVCEVYVVDHSGACICDCHQQEGPGVPTEKQYFIRYKDMFWMESGNGYTWDIFLAGLFPAEVMLRKFGSCPEGSPRQDYRNTRGDYCVEVGSYLVNHNYKEKEFIQVLERVAFYRKVLRDTKEGR